MKSRLLWTRGGRQVGLWLQVAIGGGSRWSQISCRFSPLSLDLFSLLLLLLSDDWLEAGHHHHGARRMRRNSLLLEAGRWIKLYADRLAASAAAAAAAATTTDASFGPSTLQKWADSNIVTTCDVHIDKPAIS